MIGYKGFDKNLCCRDFQYEIGKTYRCDSEIKICESGFHFCDTPLAVFEFYSPTSRFALVEATGQILRGNDNDHKFCTNEIHIIKELPLVELINSANEKTTNTGYGSVATNTGNCSVATNTSYCSAATNTGNYSAATNTADCSVATNTGYRSVATNTGYYSAATNTGNYSAATNTAECSVATNTGYYSAATNTGDYSAATNTGDYSAATNTGDCSVATNTGYGSAAIVTGKNSIAVAAGDRCKAKGTLNCWLVLCEYQDSELVDVRAFKVDGKVILPDVFYTLKKGDPVPAND